MSKGEYRMPQVYQGQTVIWYAAIGSEGAPAIVTRVGDKSLCLSVFVPGYANAISPDGVLHVSDPQVQQEIEREEGVWDYTDGDKGLAKIINELAAPNAKAASKSS